MIGAFRVLTFFVSYRLVPFRTALLILIPVASLVVAFVRASKVNARKIETGISSGVTVSTLPLACYRNLSSLEASDFSLVPLCLSISVRFAFAHVPLLSNLPSIPWFTLLSSSSIY